MPHLPGHPATSSRRDGCVWCTWHTILMKRATMTGERVCVTTVLRSLLPAKIYGKMNKKKWICQQPRFQIRPKNALSKWMYYKRPLRLGRNKDVTETGNEAGYGRKAYLCALSAWFFYVTSDLPWCALLFPRLTSSHEVEGRVNPQQILTILMT